MIFSENWCPLFRIMLDPSANQQDVGREERERQRHAEAREKQLCGFSHVSPNSGHAPPFGANAPSTTFQA